MDVLKKGYMVQNRCPLRKCYTHRKVSAK